MKIALISFDFWHYDQHIVNVLTQKNIEAHHINIGAYKHKSVFAKIKNAFYKVFFNKNLKNQYRQELILNSLQKLGKQDQILVINPETISLEYHQQIKKYTTSYKAYLYDSVARCPVEHLLKEKLFDKIYSFDKKDCKTYHFTETTNYNYLPKEKPTPIPKLDLIYVGSIDERLDFLEKLAEKCRENHLKYQFYAIGKKASIFKLKQGVLGQLKSIEFQRKRLSQAQTLDLYRNANVILDVVRHNQTGLSFRLFESMALGKKIISTNQNLNHYDLANSPNILVLKQDLSNFEAGFFSKKFVEYPSEIYHHYTLEHWVDEVFELKLTK